MIYDCIIVGAGPAGSVCAYILARAGYKCLILEKRSEIDEKICGGFLPNRAREYLLNLNIDISEVLDIDAVKIYSCMTVKGKKEHLFNYEPNKYGIGTYRKTLDQVLLDKALSQGAEIMFSTEVKNICKTDEYVDVEGHLTKKVVFATGACGHKKINIFQCSLNEKQLSGQTFGISEIIRGNSTYLKDRVYFLYEDEKSMDYFWVIPISNNVWNIGLWCQKPEKTMKKKFYELKKKYIDSYFTTYETLRTPKGALCGNVDIIPYMQLSCLGAGDFSGTNQYESGEGLYYALVSAKEAAEKVIEQLRS